jgi:hypothetical protein
MGPSGMTPEAVQQYLAFLAQRGLLGEAPDLTPVSPATVTGMAQPAAPGSSVAPMGERAMQGLLDYGPVPAKIATEMVRAPGNAVEEAITDPSLANLTNAGVQLGLGVSPLKPLAGAAMAGGSAALGYGTAAARDAGVSLLPKARAQDNDRVAEIRREIARITAEKNKVLTGRIRGRGAEAAARVQALSESFDTQITALQQEASGIMEAAQRKMDQEREVRLKAEGDKKAADLAEYNRAVSYAEKVKADELGRANRFEDSEVGKVYGKLGIVTPALAAAGAGALSKMAMGAKAGRAPLLTGMGTGAVTAHYPLAHDALLTPAENPERRAYEGYARELPPTHPRRQEWMDYARGLPQDNPTRAAASRELYDPIKFAERTGIGLLEGAISGPAGAHMASALGKAPGALVSGAAKLPGHAGVGYQTQRAKALEAATEAERAKAGLVDARARVQGASGLLDEAGQLSQAAPRGPVAGLADDALPMPQGATPQAVQPSTAPIPQPSPAPSRNPLAALPDNQNFPRNWANLWSEPSRGAVRDFIKNNPGVPLSQITAPKLIEEIAKRLPPGAPLPSESLARRYLSQLRGAVGGKADMKALDKALSSDPSRSLFSAVPVVGAGVGAGLLADFED